MRGADGLRAGWYVTMGIWRFALRMKGWVWILVIRLEGS
jgi:hypothetical protein